MMQNKIYNIQDHAILLGNLVRSLTEILRIYEHKFSLSFDGVLLSKINNPIPIIERFILENWSTEDWKKDFYITRDTSIPTRILIPFSEDIVERVVVNNLLSISDKDFNDLPTDDPYQITPVSMKKIKMRQEEYQRIKKQIWKEILINSFELDYDVFKDPNTVQFFRRMTNFYSLAFEKRIQVDNTIKKIADPERNVKSFTARRFEIKNVGEVKEND